MEYSLVDVINKVMLLLPLFVTVHLLQILNHILVEISPHFIKSTPTAVLACLLHSFSRQFLSACCFAR